MSVAHDDIEFEFSGEDEEKVDTLEPNPPLVKSISIVNLEDLFSEEDIPKQKEEEKEEEKKNKRLLKINHGRISGRKSKSNILFNLVCVALFALYVHQFYDPFNVNDRNRNRDVLMYPLKLNRGFNTSSYKYTSSDNDVVPLSTIVQQLKVNLKLHPDYTTLCMHHLQHPVKRNYRICVLYNAARNEYIPIINPSITGGSKLETEIRVRSVRCQTDTLAKVRDTIMLDWTTEDDWDRVYGIFKGADAIMLQIVVAEMRDGVQC